MRNRASPTMTSPSDKRTSWKLSLLLFNTRSYAKENSLCPTFHNLVKFRLVAETSLDVHTPNYAVAITEYKSCRESRQSHSRNGCSVYVRETLPTTLYQDSMLSTIRNAVWVGAWMGNEWQLVGCFYRSELLWKWIVVITELTNSVSGLSSTNMPTGDFSVPVLCRPTLPAPNCLIPLLQSINQHGWTQNVTNQQGTAMLLTWYLQSA